MQALKSTIVAAFIMMMMFLATFTSASGYDHQVYGSYGGAGGADLLYKIIEVIVIGFAVLVVFVIISLCVTCSTLIANRIAACFCTDDRKKDCPPNDNTF